MKYQALAAGKVDVIDGYSTDGLIARYDLVVLEDDRRFFPPYEAAALVGRGLAERRPDAIAALTELSGTAGRGHHARSQPAGRGRRASRWRAWRRDALADLGLTGAGSVSRPTAAEAPQAGPRRAISGSSGATLLRMTGAASAAGGALARRGHGGGRAARRSALERFARRSGGDRSARSACSRPSPASRCSRS